MQSALKVLIQNLAALVNIKSIVTLSVVGCLCALAIRQNTRVTSEMLAAAVSSVVTYFLIESVGIMRNNVQKE